MSPGHYQGYSCIMLSLHVTRTLPRLFMYNRLTMSPVRSQGYSCRHIKHSLYTSYNHNFTHRWFIKSQPFKTWHIFTFIHCDKTLLICFQNITSHFTLSLSKNMNISNTCYKTHHQTILVHIKHNLTLPKPCHTFSRVMKNIIKTLSTKLLIKPKHEPKHVFMKYDSSIHSHLHPFSK